MNGCTPRCTLGLVTVIVLLAAAGCGADGHARGGEVPITTSSEQPRELYLQGRELADTLRFTDARLYFLDAVSEDAGFRLAHLALFNSSPTTQEGFEALARAVECIEGLSDGERDMILAVESGAKGDRAAQLSHLSRLVEVYPVDKRAHNLLGNHYFNRQQFDEAIASYEQAVEIDPEFSSPYNGMGYALRGLGRYDEAAAALQKYIELIPDEPNPYDSYADLLMKMGRFEEAIENYEKALSLNPNFIGSHLGIGASYVFLDRPEQARESFGRLMAIARNDGERRQALLWVAASCVHERKHDNALARLEQRRSIAEAGGDLAAVSLDLVLMGDVLLDAGRPDEAMARYREAVQTMESAELPDELKENARRDHLYARARVALARGDLPTAEAMARSFGERVAVLDDPGETRRHHELLGRIALLREDYAASVAELEQAGRQDPVVLVLQAQACDGMGDSARSRELLERAANFNGLAVNYAYVRAEARELLEETRP